MKTLRTTYKTLNCPTGRIYCEDYSINQIPVPGRRAVVPHKGNVFVYGDYSCAEFKLLLAMAHQEDMYEALNSDLDVHTETAKRVYHTEEVTPEMRRKAKIVNYGIPYGITPGSLAFKLGVSEQEAKDLLSEWYKAYPKVAQFLKACENEFKQNSCSTTIFGHRRDLSKSEYSVGLRQARNNPIQGGVGFILKMAIVKAYRAFKDAFPNTYLTANVYDSILMEVPAEFEEEGKKLLAECMKFQVIGTPVVLTAKIRSGKTWAEAAHEG